MMTAKIFENGRNKTNKWNSFMQAIDMFSEDFMDDGRADEIKQELEDLLDTDDCRTCEIVGIYDRNE